MLVAVHNGNKCVHYENTIEVYLESVGYLYFIYSHFFFANGTLIFLGGGVGEQTQIYTFQDTLLITLDDMFVPVTDATVQTN